MAGYDWRERGPCRRCWCAESRHCHYRDGEDCGTCGKALCPSYQPPHQPSVLPLAWLLVALVVLVALFT